MREIIKIRNKNYLIQPFKNTHYNNVNILFKINFYGNLNLGFGVKSIKLQKTGTLDFSNIKIEAFGDLGNAYIIYGDNDDCLYINTNMIYDEYHQNMSKGKVLIPYNSYKMIKNYKNVSHVIAKFKNFKNLDVLENENIELYQILSEI